MITRQQKIALDAAYEFMKITWDNVGDDDDWPIRITLDEDIAKKWLKLGNAARKRLIECGYNFDYPNNGIEE